MKRYLIGLAALLLLSACKKEIYMNYHSIEPLYVVEAVINEQSVEVMVTTTRNMKEVEKGTPVQDAYVMLSSSNAQPEILVFDATNGNYRSTVGTTGLPGTTYSLAISDGTNQFVSTSRMHISGEIGPLSFIYRPDLSEKHIICKMSILDEGSVNNYYQLRLNKNGETQEKQLLTDNGYDGGSIPILLPVRFSLGEQPEPEEGKKQDHIFRKGDILEIELRTIDRYIYDYLYSINLSGNISFNPTNNFEGGCLGYFSAFSADTYSMIFDPEEILKE